jgi:hypothetical protein
MQLRTKFQASIAEQTANQLREYRKDDQEVVLKLLQGTKNSQKQIFLILDQMRKNGTNDHPFVQGKRIQALEVETRFTESSDCTLIKTQEVIGPFDGALKPSSESISRQISELTGKIFQMQANLKINSDGTSSKHKKHRTRHRRREGFVTRISEDRHCEKVLEGKEEEADEVDQEAEVLKTFYMNQDESGFHKTPESTEEPRSSSIALKENLLRPLHHPLPIPPPLLMMMKIQSQKAMSIVISQKRSCLE